MALPTSGAISLNQMHVEAGGSSGTTASINDADIRALIGKASGVQMSFSEWYGASASVWDIDITVGNYNFKGANFWGYDNGFYGSTSDTTCDFKSGATLEFLHWYSASNTLTFTLAGNHTNAGFTTMTVGSDAYNRSASSYSYSSGNNQTTWAWSTTTNSFGTTVGAVKDVVFT